MILREIIERFEMSAPACVMTRALLENIFSADRLNAIFESSAERQSNKTLLFSSVADIMGLVACKVHPSVHAAFVARKDEIAVTIKAVYDKLQRMESNVSRDVVRETAERMSAIIYKMKAELPGPLPGYRVKILDGNHLRRSERRLHELRDLNAAPLPGYGLAVLDPQLKLVIDIFPCEDAYVQERKLLPQVLDTVKRKDLWIADRNFSTTDFLLGLIERSAYFCIRQHSNSLRYELIGKAKKLGRTEGGTVYEQAMRLFATDGTSTTIRRITIKLDKPTRDGDTELHVLTNLPKRITAMQVLGLYRGRWNIEVAFLEVAKNLNAEIETLGYPRAALFGFCMALVVFNVLSVVRAALRAGHDLEKTDEELSIFYLCEEVAHVYRGMAIVVPDKYWTKQYAHLSPTQMARQLIRIAKQVDLSRYRKHKRGPKKPKAKQNKKYRSHISTARVLALSRGGT